MKSQMLAQLQQQQQRQQQQQLFMPFSNFVVITVAATDVSHAKYWHTTSTDSPQTWALLQAYICSSLLQRRVNAVIQVIK